MISSSVLPSGSARDAASKPITLPPPGRFSTTTVTRAPARDLIAELAGDDVAAAGRRRRHDDLDGARGLRPRAGARRRSAAMSKACKGRVSEPFHVSSDAASLLLDARLGDHPAVVVVAALDQRAEIGRRRCRPDRGPARRTSPSPRAPAIASLNQPVEFGELVLRGPGRRHDAEPVVDLEALEAGLDRRSARSG